MSSLFDNPMVNAAKKAMTPEQLEEYKRIGEHMFGNMDFSTGQSFPPNFKEAGEYLSEAIKSGLHPSMMEDNEKAVMKEVYGEKWWEKFGFVEGDLTEMVTIERGVVKDK